MNAIDKEILLGDLKDTCSSIGYAIRFEKGDFYGGACILREQQLLVVNKRFSVDQKLTTIARALNELGVETVYLKPSVRNFIEAESFKNKIVGF